MTLTATDRPRVVRWGQSRLALWIAFAGVHAWLTYVGVVLLPAKAFYDVDLYRYWVALGLDGGPWPVLDGAWVYPVGALLPMLVPAAVSITSTAAYALAWCALVTTLNAVAAHALVRRGGPGSVWWWLAFLLLLGPVAVGRIDAILAPIVVLALVVALRRPRLAAALVTLGAWIKVAPGVVVLPLLVIARRPVRDVIVPAALVCAGFVAAVAAGGGLRWLTSFLFTQDTRGLQVEAVAATPWVLAALVRDDVTIYLNRALITWEITGPGTTVVARALDVVLPLAVVGIAALLWRARARPLDVLLWGSLALATVLIVVNKVGSPQYVGWLAPPVAVALALRSAVPDGVPRLSGSRALAGPVAPGRSSALNRIAVGVLGIAGLTQVIFPIAYAAVLASQPVITVVLATRNAALVALLTAVGLLLARGDRRPAQPPLPPPPPNPPLPPSLGAERPSGR